MPIYTFRDKQISEINRTQFGIEGIQERADLQAALRDNINVISKMSSYSKLEMVS